MLGEVKRSEGDSAPLHVAIVTHQLPVDEPSMGGYPVHAAEHGWCAGANRCRNKAALACNYGLCGACCGGCSTHAALEPVGCRGDYCRNKASQSCGYGMCGACCGGCDRHC
jgi:hypothetical protein